MVFQTEALNDVGRWMLQKGEKSSGNLVGKGDVRTQARIMSDAEIDRAEGAKESLMNSAQQECHLQEFMSELQQAAERAFRCRT